MGSKEPGSKNLGIRDREPDIWRTGWARRWRPCHPRVGVRTATLVVGSPSFASPRVVVTPPFASCKRARANGKAVRLYNGTPLVKWLSHNYCKSRFATCTCSKRPKTTISILGVPPSVRSRQRQCLLAYNLFGNKLKRRDDTALFLQADAILTLSRPEESLGLGSPQSVCIYRLPLCVD